MNKTNSKLGEIRYNTFGTPMQIVEYNAFNDIVVEFLDLHRVRRKTTYSVFKAGNIRNPYDRSAYNIGYLGEGKKKTYGKHRGMFIIWNAMIERCYSEELREKYPTYENCYVCDTWHNYQKFASWYSRNYYNVGNERMHLDKDILYKNNNIYSPETCLIVPQRINMIFTKRKGANGLPAGVIEKNNGKYEAQYNNKSIGVFETIEEAAIAHDKRKKEIIIDVANDYKDKIPEKVYNALINWIPDYIEYSC